MSQPSKAPPALRSVPPNAENARALQPEVAIRVASVTPSDIHRIVAEHAPIAPTLGEPLSSESEQPASLSVARELELALAHYPGAVRILSQYPAAVRILSQAPPAPTRVISQHPAGKVANVAADPLIG